MSSASIRVVYKSIIVLADMFWKPKGRATKVETKGIVCKVKMQMLFVYLHWRE